MTDRPSDPLPLDEQLCFSLYGAGIAMNRAYKPLLDRLGITYPQYLVLQALWEADGRTIGGLAGRLSLESSTITPLVKRLETGGLVKRTRDVRDERQVRVALTDKGDMLRGEGLCLARTVFARTGMDEGAVRQLTRTLQALQGALTQPD